MPTYGSFNLRTKFLVTTYFVSLRASLVVKVAKLES
jgi:hypothetical protein